MIKPTDQELKTFACEWWHKFGFVKDKATCTWLLDEVSPEHFVDFARDILARWGRTALLPAGMIHAGYIHRQGNHWELSERPLLDDEIGRGWTQEPVYRAALAQPEPEAAGPTDDELTLTYAYAVAAAVDNRRGPYSKEDAEAAQLAGLRAVIARWGRPAPVPVPVSTEEEDAQ